MEDSIMRSRLEDLIKKYNQKRNDDLLNLFNEVYRRCQMHAEMKEQFIKNDIKIIDEKISKNIELQNRLENDIKIINEKLNLIK